MLGSNLRFLNNRTLLTGICRCIQTDLTLMRNVKRGEKKAKEEESERKFYAPGMSRRLNVFKDDPEFINKFEGEEDFEELESPDFMNVDQMYDEDQRDRKKERSRLRAIMTRKKMMKFFVQPREPTMLTYNEREHIKFLHETDSQEWTPEKLAESFPATSIIIKKILRSKFKPESVERMKRYDAKVHQNWKLLAEGKLDADPEYIEHLKKFVDRRETLLEQIQNPNFYHLPEPKNKVNWPEGPMTKLLMKYEKKLEELDKKMSEELKPKEINTENEGNFSKMNEERMINTNIIQKRIEFEKEYYRTDEVQKCSFVLGNDVNPLDEPLTCDEFMENIKQSSAENKNLSIFEKALLENEIASSTLKLTSENDDKLKFISAKENMKEEDAFGLVFSEEQEKNANPQKLPKDLTEKTERECAAKIEKAYNVKEGEEKDSFVFGEFPKEQSKEPDPEWLSKDKTYRSDEAGKASRSTTRRKLESDDYYGVDPFDEMYECDEEELNARVLRLNPEEMGKKFDFSNNEPKAIENVTEESVVPEKKVKSRPVLTEEMMVKDREYFKNEVEEIKDTFFWNSGSKKQNKIKVKYSDLSKQETNDVSTHKSQQSIGDLFNDDRYPLRIKIPKDKQGTGLTFKVKDCYYDDDGEFLYRVPGMFSNPGK